MDFQFFSGHPVYNSDNNIFSLIHTFHVLEYVISNCYFQLSHISSYFMRYPDI